MKVVFARVLQNTIPILSLLPAFQELSRKSMSKRLANIRHLRMPAVMVSKTYVQISKKLYSPKTAGAFNEVNCLGTGGPVPFFGVLGECPHHECVRDRIHEIKV